MRAFTLSFADASLCCVLCWLWDLHFEISYSWFQSIWTWCFKQKIMVDWHTRRKKNLSGWHFFDAFFGQWLKQMKCYKISRGWSQADKKEYKNERNKQMELDNTFETELMAMTLKSHILFFLYSLSLLFFFLFCIWCRCLLHLNDEMALTSTYFGVSTF